MARYRKIGYVALGVCDVARSRAFYRDMVGLEDVGPGPQGSALLRCSSDHFNIMLCPAEKPHLVRAGFQMESADELADLRSRLLAAGIVIEEVADAECAELQLGSAFRIQENFTGTSFEFYQGMSETAALFVPTVAKIQRLGHIVLRTPELSAAKKWFVDVLNFRISDEIRERVAFMRCFPNPLHHSLGLGSSSRRGISHVNFMVSEVDDIGRAMWRFQRADVPVVHGPGRHPPSGSMFYYFLDPDGMTVEYSFGMEEFPEVGARQPRVLAAHSSSVDYWGAVVDPRKGAIG